LLIATWKHLSDGPVLRDKRNRHYGVEEVFDKSAGRTFSGRRPMSRQKRILAGLGIAIIVCSTYLWLFGVQSYFALGARYMARKMPVLKMVPVAPPDSSISKAPGSKLSYFGYEFEVPWDDIDEAKSRIVGDIAIITFRSGNVLSVWNGSPHSFINTVVSSGKLEPDTFRQLYGDKAMESDYALLRIMLETTPDKITPFVSKKQAVSCATLLLMKGFAAARGESGIFAVTAGEFEGFQFGRPQNLPIGYDVELFSDSGSLDFVFGQKVNGPTLISQPDINRILNTIHKVPAATMASATRSN